MNKAIKSKMLFLLGLCIVYLAVGLLLRINQRKLLYFPTKSIAHPYGRRVFKNDQQLIEVIVLNKGQSRGLLYFGGNGESVVYNVPDFGKIFPDYTVYLVNYRGYGGSTGAPSEQALYADAQHIYDTVKKSHSAIAVIGRSLGSGVATYLASTRALSKLALVTPYDSIQSVAQGRFPIYPMALLLQDKYDSLGRVPAIKVKTLIIIAENDTVIPLKHSKRLAAAFPAEQILVEQVMNVGHNTLSEDKSYYALLSRFFALKKREENESNSGN